MDDFLKIDIGESILDIDPWLDEDFGYVGDDFDDIFDVDPLLDEFIFVGEFS